MKRILIVDDDESIVRLVTTRLKANGYEVFSAFDGYQGFKVAKAKKPDLIILDLQMPAGGGVGTFNNLKSTIYTSNIPIIVFTAFPGSEVNKLVIEMGADSFLSKPFSSEELLKQINKLLGQ